MTKEESQFRTNREVVREILDVVSYMKGDVNDLKSDVRSIKEKHDNLNHWKNSYEGKVTAIETAVQSFQLEKAKLGFASKIAVIGLSFLGTILGGTAIGVFVFYITK